MLDFIKNMFKSAEAPDLKQWLKEGAVIVDVRSPQEFKSGHIKGAINIPLDRIDVDFKKIPHPEKGVITCCASGMRSAAAKRVLAAKGVTKIYNGGGWSSLNSKL
jgi:rhodanese-related sulfurtransferase